MASRDKVPFGMPPWHMWGTKQTLTLSGGAIASRQLSKIAYKRPETWSMFFAAQVVSASSGGPSLTLEIDFEVMFGVGRTFFDTSGGFALATAGNNALVYMNFVLPMPYVPSVFGIKYTTVAHGPPLDDVSPLVRERIDWLPAQDIQCRAGARATPSVGSQAVIDVYSWFAPRSHVRPDWFGDDPVSQFLGGERNGT